MCIWFSKPNCKLFLAVFVIDSGVFDRQDSLRSDYLSDRESRYGIVQQASIDSTDSRLCYLTSSEVSDFFLNYIIYYICYFIFYIIYYIFVKPQRKS